MREHQVAWWAGVVSFFASLLAVGVFDLINAGKWVNLLASTIVAAITGGAVYARQRLVDAKKAAGDDSATPDLPGAVQRHGEPNP